jgi:hypothetical protein
MVSTKMIVVIILDIVLAVTVCLWFSCTKQKVMESGKIFSPTESSSESITLKGQVIDVKTGTGIPNATVAVAGVATVTTDAVGFYEVANISVGSYHVIASKAEYSSSFSTATVDSISASVYAIYLTPLSSPVTVGTTGGTVSAKDPDSNVTSLIIPAGALSGQTEITVTPLIGLEMPALPPANRMAIATVHLGPQNTSLQDSATISIQLPLKLSSRDTIPLFSYNDQTDSWQETGIVGTVGEDSITFTAKTVDLKIYAVMPEVQSSTTTDSLSTSVSENYLSCDDTFYMDTQMNDFEIQDSGNFSKTFCKNLSEQTHGISFSHPSIYFETYYCTDEETMLSFSGNKINRIAEINEQKMCKKEIKVRRIKLEWQTKIIFGVTVHYLAIVIIWDTETTWYDCHDQGGGNP